MYVKKDPWAGLKGTFSIHERLQCLVPYEEDAGINWENAGPNFVTKVCFL